MAVLPRKGLLAIVVVVDVALQDGRRISAKALATRHGLRPRHLELVLQSLVRDGILKGTRGPYGGYELGRERHSVTASDILRAAGTVHEAGEQPNSEHVAEVVLPALSVVEQEFGPALSRISLDDLVHRAALNGNGTGPHDRGLELVGWSILIVMMAFAKLTMRSLPAKQVEQSKGLSARPSFGAVWHLPKRPPTEVAFRLLLEPPGC